MRVRDLAANLLADIAEECGFCVSRYTTTGEASGNITFMLIDNEEVDWDEAIENTKY